MDDTLMNVSELDVHVVGSNPDAVSRVLVRLEHSGVDDQRITSSEAIATAIPECDVLVLVNLAFHDRQSSSVPECIERSGSAVLVLGDDEQARQTGWGRSVVYDCLSWDEATPHALERSLRHVVELNRLHQRLHAENRRLLKVIEANADGILVVDYSGEVLFANRAASQLLGRAAETLKGSQFGYPVLNGDHADIELQNGCRNGRTAELRAVDISWEGHPAKLLSLRDVSVRKRAEARADAYRKRVQRLNSELTRSEERERRRLARVLHDDIQQSLVAAKMAVNMVAGQSSPENAQQLKKSVHFIEAAVETSRTLAKELTPTVLDDLGLVPALHWLSRLNDERYGQTVSVRADDGLRVFDEDLRGFVFQSVRELLFNVTKHAACAPVTVTLKKHAEDTLRITVQDEGPGFDPTQLESEERTTGGFGLFQIQQRIEDFGGELRIASPCNSGTEIVLTIPNKKEQSSGAETATEVPHEGALRVVMIDDSPALTDLMSAMLRMNSDVDVVGTATTGEEGLNLALRTKPDAALVDVSLPDLPGTEVARRIHQELPETRVIGFSMHDSPDVAKAMMASGAVAYLKKDQPIEEILESLLSPHL